MKPRYLIAILIIVFLVESLLAVPEVWGPGKHFMAAVLPSLVVDYANTDRANAQTSTLQINPLLTQAAQLKANDMAARSYFSHQGPAGEAPWTWLDHVGYKYVYAGENLALDFYDSSEVNQAWMNSPKHRENILDKNFTDIGVGMAEGQLAGRDSIFIVQFFGSTQDSLAKQAKTPATLGFRRANVLLSAVSLSDKILTRLRSISLPFFRRLGLPKVNGKII